MSIEAIESVFGGAVAILPDAAHSAREPRHRAIGRTPEGRVVFIVFTLRKRGGATLLRPISARFMHAKEVRSYEKENPELQKRS